jgi:uncharacterized membrane protein
MGENATKRETIHDRPGFLRQYFRALRFYFITGLLVWVPLIVTAWVTWWLIKTVGLGLEGLIQRGYEGLHRIGDRVPQLEFLTGLTYVRGFGFLIAAALFLTTGFLTRSIVARRLIRAAERILDRIPLISKLYRAVQQIRDVFITREGAVFQKVALVQYPREGVWVVGFLMSREQGTVQEALGGEHLAVFVPSIPNPTTGFLMFFRPSEVKFPDLTIEEGMKIIISGGAYLTGTESALQAKAKTEGHENLVDR